MKNKVISALKNRTVWILILISAAGGIVYGLIKPPFYLHFIDGMTYFAFFYLLIGIIRWGWIRSDFVYFSWKPEKGSYNKYRRRIMEDRTNKKNPVLTAGVITVIISAVLALLY